MLLIIQIATGTMIGILAAKYLGEDEKRADKLYGFVLLGVFAYGVFSLLSPFGAIAIDWLMDTNKGVQNWVACLIYGGIAFWLLCGIVKLSAKVKARFFRRSDGIDATHQ
jgi:hypothetical protein